MTKIDYDDLLESALEGRLATMRNENAHMKELVRKRDEELMALYRRLATAELSAQQGWQRYEAANNAHLGLQEKMAQRCDEKVKYGE